MAIIQLVPIHESPTNSEIIQNQIRFLINPVNQLSHRCGGCNFIGRDASDIACQFCAVYDYYGHSYYISPIHIVVIFDLETEDFVRTYQAERIAERFCKDMFQHNHQVVWSVREYEYTRNIDFIVNTISFRNGSILPRNYTLLKKIFDSMNKILADNHLWHGIHPIHNVDLIFD